MLEFKLLALVLFAFLSCKKTQKKTVISNEQTVQKSATDKKEFLKNDKLFLRVWNKRFVKNYKNLERNGKVKSSQTPKSGYWYPNSDGGTANKFGKSISVLTKYDRAFNNNDSSALNWEIKHHNSKEKWHGHCNGFAAATQRHPLEPFQNVSKGGSVFTPEDIKTLLAEVYMSANYVFLGGNRCKLNRVTTRRERNNVEVMGKCEDINPATMHLALTNWIGREKHTIIMDENSGLQVWNFPVNSYNIRSLQVIDKARAISLTGSNSREYIYNTNAAKFLQVRMEIGYTKAYPKKEGLRNLIPGKFVLDYILEVDSADNIIGGEWIGNSIQKHPDFMWIALPVLKPNGSKLMGNPFIDSKKVIELWAESTGQDLDNIIKDIDVTNNLSPWGKFESYEVSIDDNNRGAVYSGLENTLKLKKLKNTFGSEANLKIYINSIFVNEESNINDQTTIKIKPNLGVNSLELVWSEYNRVLKRDKLSFIVLD